MRKRINQKRKTTANVCSIDDMAGQQPSSSYFARPLNFGGMDTCACADLERRVSFNQQKWVVDGRATPSSKSNMEVKSLRNTAHALLFAPSLLH